MTTLPEYEKNKRSAVLYSFLKGENMQCPLANCKAEMILQLTKNKNVWICPKCQAKLVTVDVRPEEPEDRKQ